MLKINGKDITGVRVGTIAIKAIRNGAVLVWQAIRSAFGNGYWDNNMPWDNNEGWRN